MRRSKYDVFIEERNGEYFACAKIKIGPATCLLNEIKLTEHCSNIKIIAAPYNYTFYANEQYLGTADTRYLSSEVACGFTGDFIGLYAQNGAVAKFTDFKTEHYSR